MHVTASQIRQDLNNFGGFGQQGYGYNVAYLHEEIGNILGVNDTHNVIVIGAGNLGQAIAGYVNSILLLLFCFPFTFLDEEMTPTSVTGIDRCRFGHQSNCSHH